MSEVKKRSEMDPAYMWAMTDLYPDDEAWEKELGVLEGRIPEYRDYEGKLGESAEKLGSFFKFSDEIGKMSARVYVYANQMLHQDMAEAKYQEMMAQICETCTFLEEECKIPREDAALLLPLGMTTKIVDKRNLRNLIDMSHQRMCTRAYWEYRELFSDIAQALAGISEEWKYIVENYFVPKCELTGYCTEKKSCGRKPKKEA